MAGRRLTFLFLLAAALACRSGKSVPEPGALLLQVKCAPGAPRPDELRVWVYDDGGVLWDGVRVPAQGPLVAASGQSLGTILIAPGAFTGRLRVHLRGLAAGTRILDGWLVVASLAEGERTYPLLLDSAVLVDADGDDVPDAIDDCLGIANPAQGGCNAVLFADAAVGDGLPGPRDAFPSDAPVEGVTAGDDARGGADDVARAGDAVGADLPDNDLGRPEAGPDVAPPPSDSVPDRASPDLLGSEDVPDLPAPERADAGPDVAPDGPGDVGVDTRDAGGDATDGADATSVLDDGGTLLPQGAECEANEACASGACADGVCCTNACTGRCRSCNQPSANGVCQGYPVGTDPELECGGGACNGVGACGSGPSPDLPNGYLCTAASQCKSGYCIDGVCCNTDCTAACMTCGGGTCVAVKRADDVPECTGTTTCNPAGKCVSR